MSGWIQAAIQQNTIFNLKSRSTFLDRPRAKSEELMVVKQKFPHQMPDAQKKQNNSTQWVKLTIFVPKIDETLENYGFEICYKESRVELKSHNMNRYRKVASTNASRFVTRLVYMHTQNENFLIRSSS